MWVLDYLEDLESDFSVFHRVEDIYSLDGPRFFRLAMRISAYAGVMQARVTEEQEKRRKRLGVSAADGEMETKSLSDLEKTPGAGGLFERKVVTRDGRGLQDR